MPIQGLRLKSHLMAQIKQSEGPKASQKSPNTTTFSLTTCGSGGPLFHMLQPTPSCAPWEEHASRTTRKDIGGVSCIALEGILSQGCLLFPSCFKKKGNVEQRMKKKRETKDRKDPRSLFFPSSWRFFYLLPHIPLLEPPPTTSAI